MDGKDISLSSRKRPKLERKCKDRALTGSVRYLHSPDDSEPPPALYRTIQIYETRLLLLMPKRCGLELTAELVTTPIAPRPKASNRREDRKQGLVDYTAISYCWGTDDPEHIIQISGIDVPIKKNLCDFLHQYRHDTEQRILWIDALCINQKNTVERASQVSSMRKIYEYAKDVIVWLGERGKHTDQAFEYMKKTSSLWMGRPYVDWSQNTIDEVILGAEDIYKREWIRRIWVIQEVWAAKEKEIPVWCAEEKEKEISVWCGSINLSWETFIGGARHGFTKEYGALPSNGPRLEFNFQQALQNFWNLSGQSMESNQSTLLQHVLRTTTSEFTEKRDRIYSLLGMAVEGSAFNVDYNSPVAVVFAKFTKYLMKKYGIYRILVLDAVFGGNIDGHNLPSWSPDWRTVTKLEYFDSKGFDPCVRAFQSSQMHTKFDSDSELFQSLTLRGSRIAKIGADASDSRFKYRVSWNGREFLTELEDKCSTNSATARLLADVPIEYIKPFKTANTTEYVSRGDSWYPQRCKLAHFAAPLAAKKGDWVVTVENGSRLSLPAILRDASEANADLVGQFTFVGFALPMIRYSLKNELHLGQAEFLGVDNSTGTYTLI